VRRVSLTGLRGKGVVGGGEKGRGRMKKEEGVEKIDRRGFRIHDQGGGVRLIRLGIKGGENRHKNHRVIVPKLV